MIACYQGYCLERPLVTLLAIPFFFLLLFFLSRSFVNFRSPEEKARFRRSKRWLRLTLLISRTLIFTLLLVAYANPYTTAEVTTHGDPIIKVLVDSSASMEVFDPDVLDTVKAALGNVPLDIRQIASGEQSALGDGILRSIQGHDNLLLITDGRATSGKDLLDVGTYARLSDTRLFALDLAPETSDSWVVVDGPGEVIAGTASPFNIRVHSVGSVPSFTLQVHVDDQLYLSAASSSLQREGEAYLAQLVPRFSPGYHKITAQITLTDQFSQNNVFHKSVKAIEKPEVLFISESGSPLQQGLEEIYELSSQPSLPSAFQRYDAIVFNNIPYPRIASSIDSLTGYLLDGGGLFFIGGKNSFDRGEYQGTLLESMLPVSIGSGKVISPLDHNIVIVIDVSESFSDYGFKEGGEETALDLGKGLALKMVENFRDDISVGVVAFASVGQLVSPIEKLSENRKTLEEKIKRLGKGEGTSIDQGLLWADIALGQVKGTKNVILISDGKMGKSELPAAPRVMADRLASKGARIYTIGIPSVLNNVDINRVLMRDLAARGGGSYLEPNEAQYLNIFFGKPEAREQIFSGSSNLAILDRGHFITTDLSLNAEVTGVNFVIPKLGSRNLIFTGDGNPVLNTWNFGLGRVVTLATDDGREWAGSLLERQNSLLLTRALNYAIGNPERDKELQIRTHDSFLGEASEVQVRSLRTPTSKELSFTKQGENLYLAQFQAEEPGYYQFFDALVAINPPREYYGLGVSPELEQMTKLSGGSLVTLDKSIAAQLTSYTERTEQQRIDVSFWPLGAALVIFILELFVRKLHERVSA